MNDDFDVMSFSKRASHTNFYKKIVFNFSRIIVLSLILLSGYVCAKDSVGSSRLLATGGATTIEGSAGGGIIPMAVIAGYGAQEEYGATAFVSNVNTRDFNLQVLGASLGWRNRLELSFAQQTLEHTSLSKALNLDDRDIRQVIVGAKLRLAGDLIYTVIPQLSVGAQFKKNEDFFIPDVAGADEDKGTDIYLTASKLFLGGFFHHNGLLNVTLRHTKANQLGLVGFGGDNNNHAQLVTEMSGGVFVNKHWLIGTEYRQKPDNLSFAREDDWQTFFIAWFPNKNISWVAAYVDLGEVATFEDQSGWYLSAQGSF